MATKKANGSGTIRKRADGRWEGKYTLGYDPKTGKLIRKSVYGKTQKEVRLALSKIVSEMDSGTYAEPSKMKVSQWLDEWLASYTMNIKPATRSAYEEHIRVHIKPSLGDIPLKQLSTRDIQQLYTNLLKERELSPKTVRNIHGVLHRTLEQAKLLGYIRVNPADAAVTPRMEKKQVETLDAEDIGKFLAAIRGTKYEYPLFVAVFTGLRQGELLGLTWDCVDFEHGMLLINKQHNRVKGDTEFRFASLKNDKARVLTAADEVMEVLKLQKERQTAWAAALGDGWSNPDHLVFTTEFGRYINNKILYQNFKRIMRKLGKPNLRFHDLRHPYVKPKTKKYGIIFEVFGQRNCCPWLLHRCSWLMPPFPVLLFQGNPALHIRSRSCLLERDRFS